MLTFTNYIETALSAAIEKIKPNRVLIFTDTNVERDVIPLIPSLAEIPRLAMRPGDENKNLSTLVQLWDWLVEAEATRRTLLVNIGGGVVTDLGGFGASTFKRSMPFINIPTSLLAAVDASIGGKTGINFSGLKNEIGSFAQPYEVIISSLFLRTLPREELLSGYAEMIKHALLDNAKHLADLTNTDFTTLNNSERLKLIRRSVAIKESIVEEDPTEKGLRKVLNFGHTVGHAIESKSLIEDNPISHGYAVAWGLQVALVLSRMILGFPSGLVSHTLSYIRDFYGEMPVSCDDYDKLIELMRHDKKSNNCELNFALLRAPGEFVIDCTVTEKDVRTALDIARNI